MRVPRILASQAPLLAAFALACGDSAGPTNHEPVTAIAVGLRYSCALALNGTAYCWGDAPSGFSADPVPVMAGHTVASISAGVMGYLGLDYTCAVTSAGAAYCWGPNMMGRLGDGDTTAGGGPTPRLVVGDLKFASLSVGYEHSCGITVQGVAYCWGAAGATGLQRGVSYPVVAAGGLVFSSISAGTAHTCALTTEGVAYCWGGNPAGQLGDGRECSASACPYYGPGPVAGGLAFTSVSASAYHTCGVTVSGAAYCWGDNYFGQLGDGGFSRQPTPVAVVGGHTFKSISAGYQHTCAVTTTGAGYCWGEDEWGQLGDGREFGAGAEASPVPVADGLVFASISAGSDHSCGATTGGAAYCWGRGGYGQLGGGQRGPSTRPRRVPGL